MMLELGRNAKAASRVLMSASSADKNAALIATAEAINHRQTELIAENKKDLDAGRARGLSEALMDRLELNAERIASMADGLRQIAALPDPVGEISDMSFRPSGIQVGHMRVPLGVVGIIYESRPNVTADAAALCLKSGNAAILRGGSEAVYSNQAIARCIHDGLRKAGLPLAAVQVVATTDRAAVSALVQMEGYVDVIVPRGGKGLVGLVQREARVPVFAHLEGIVHVYVDVDADVEKAREVILNAKTRRTGICGSAECLLIDRAFYAAHGAPFVEDLVNAGVEVRVGEGLQDLAGTIPATSNDWGNEYLDMIIAVKLVDGVDGAIAHIGEFSSNHTDAILTKNDVTAERFFQRVDSAILMRNASTQFADGGEFGMGAEIGIATGKIPRKGECC